MEEKGEKMEEVEGEGVVECSPVNFGIKCFYSLLQLISLGSHSIHTIL